MPVYMITPVEFTSITPDFEDRIRKAVPNATDVLMLPQRNSCFVAYDGTSTDLRNALQLKGSTDDRLSDNKFSTPPVTPPISAIITSIVPEGYNGYAPTDIWEWLTLKMSY